MPKKICVIGGTGFIGSHLVFKLANRGYQVLIPSRRRERHRQFLVHDNIKLVEANPNDVNNLQRLFDDTDTVVNLVGILNETCGATYPAAHVELTQRILSAMHNKGVSRLLHMSALNADATLKQGKYLRTKGEAENLVMAEKHIQATVFRPSVVFGRGDSFFNRFANLLRITPGFFPLACANARFAPVSVDNVADAFIYALEHDESIGQRYDLCGPKPYKLSELVEYTASQIDVKARLWKLTDFMSRVQAFSLGLMPGKPFSMDNYYSLQIDSICEHSALVEMGISPQSIESIVPGYLGAQDSNARYQRFRQQSRREE